MSSCALNVASTLPSPDHLPELQTISQVYTASNRTLVDFPTRWDACASREPPDVVSVELRRTSLASGIRIIASGFRVTLVSANMASVPRGDFFADTWRIEQMIHSHIHDRIFAIKDRNIRSRIPQFTLGLTHFDASSSRPAANISFSWTRILRHLQETEKQATSHNFRGTRTRVAAVVLRGQGSACIRL
ncbi:hypothetical protein BCR34DRAFT_227583 [Clohesyomyces aquaticus]|uniref:Uncharacterized protein n=1 Tax=Clohesyomyces aquaticus TaxID=1231657 RepID=A0A1Y1ZWQ9_9PLEO|nr:hypothetical protein BCR34DRAFT_227583 [Clohesyomyces aquaticus]